MCAEKTTNLLSLGKFRVVGMYSYFKELYSQSFHNSYKVNKTNEGWNEEYNCVFQARVNVTLLRKNHSRCNYEVRNAHHSAPESNTSVLIRRDIRYNHT